MRRIHWALAITAVLAGLAVYMGQRLASQHVLYLQSCAGDRAFPGSDWICSQFLFRFHPTVSEVEEMNRTAGAVWALSVAEDEEARKLLRHYVDAGLDVNAVDQRDPAVRWTGLHVAASSGDVRGVKLLLELGARPSMKDGKGRTAQDVAQTRSEQFPDDARYREILETLRVAVRAMSQTTSNERLSPNSPNRE